MENSTETRAGTWLRNYKLSPRNYLLWGLGLMVLKYNLDRVVAGVVFGKSWYFWNYIKPGGADLINNGETSNAGGLYLFLALNSVPFVIAGLVLTMGRLRSAGLSWFWCLLFFVPVVNLIFFAVLCVLPAQNTPAGTDPQPARFGKLPDGGVASAVSGLLVTGIIGLGFSYLATNELRYYGWGLFYALPFVMGMVSVLIYADRQPRTFGQCMKVAALPIVLIAVGLMALALEGLICIVMAVPVAIPLAVFGGAVGYAITSRRGARISTPGLLLILAMVPLTMGMEKQAGEAPPALQVTSAVVINAPPEKVWPYVVAFPEIPPERNWILRTGVAYPIRARIEGRGVGAIRHCIFTTGEFVEPITVWEENHRLRFSVSQQPEPMTELSPYGHLKARHLEGYFSSQQGELKLTALPGGKTLLEGTTWYTDKVWPSLYWKLWSDLLIHEIHLRVMNHIKEISEHPSRAENHVP